jgi:hypothetical protein
MKDFLATLSIDITVLLFVIFGNIEMMLKIFLLIATIIYTCIKIYAELKKVKDE